MQKKMKMTQPKIVNFREPPNSIIWFWTSIFSCCRRNGMEWVRFEYIINEYNVVKTSGGQSCFRNFYYVQFFFVRSIAARVRLCVSVICMYLHGWLSQYLHTVCVSISGSNMKYYEYIIICVTMGMQGMYFFITFICVIFFSLSHKAKENPYIMRRNISYCMHKVEWNSVNSFFFNALLPAAWRVCRQSMNRMNEWMNECEWKKTYCTMTHVCVINGFVHQSPIFALKKKKKKKTRERIMGIEWMYTCWPQNLFGFIYGTFA